MVYLGKEDNLPEPSYASGEMVAYVRYGEEQFLAYDDERKAFCYSEWIRKMEPLEGIRFLVLQLIPDPLFPTRGNELPYIYWRHDFGPRTKGKPWTVVPVVNVEYQESHFDAKHRSDIMRELAAAYPSGTRYVIRHKHNVIAQGTL